MSRNPPSLDLPSAAGHNTVTAAPSASKVNTYPIPPLDALVTRRFRATQSAPLTLSGRQLPLIYLLVATLVAGPCSKAVVVIDVEARFDVTRLLQTVPYRSATPVAERPIPSDESHAKNAQQHQNERSRGASTDESPIVPNAQRMTVDDLKHVHIYRPARGSSSHIREVLKSAEQYMVYAKHASSTREWWGTIVIGGGSPAILGAGNVDVATGWKGWLRVDRDEICRFPLGMCIEEALAERDQRQHAVENADYTATCQWGWFTFGDGSD